MNSGSFDHRRKAFIAEVVPFPSVRRRAEIEKLAELLMQYRHEAAERILRDRLARRGAAFARKGVAPDRIASDISAMESAVRGALWRHAMQGDGGAA